MIDFPSIPMTTEETIEFDKWLEGYNRQIRADAVEEYNKKIDYLKNCYVDACNMCTRMECDVCAISNFIEDLEQLKEQKGGREWIRKQHFKIISITFVKQYVQNAIITMNQWVYVVEKY